MLCGQRRAIRTFLFLDPVVGDRFERLVAIHGRLKESVPPGSVDIKRGRGGITAIKFIAQILLITHGKTTSGLAMSGTRPMLVRLLESGFRRSRRRTGPAAGLRPLPRVGEGVPDDGQPPDHRVVGRRGAGKAGPDPGGRGWPGREEELRQLMSDTREVFDSIVAAGRAEPFSRKDSDKIR